MNIDDVFTMIERLGEMIREDRFKKFSQETQNIHRKNAVEHNWPIGSVVYMYTDDFLEEFVVHGVNTLRTTDGEHQIIHTKAGDKLFATREEAMRQWVGDFNLNEDVREVVARERADIEQSKAMIDEAEMLISICEERLSKKEPNQ